MKKIQTISLLVMALTLTACNEKISPELQDASVVAPTPTSSSQASFSFKVTTTSDVGLDFLLHKTGDTFKYDPILTSDDCEVSKRIETFKREDFGKTQYDMINPADPDELLTVNDITCYLEAEELGLYMEGLKLKVESSPGACRSVRYSPYSYFNRKPGNSSATYKKVSCDTDTNATHIAAAFTVPSDITYAGGMTADCDEYLIDSRKASNNISNLAVPAASRDVFRVDADDETADLASEEELCRFNYQDKGEEKCDVGVITINDHLVSYDKAAAELEATTNATNAAILSNSDYANFVDAIDDGVPSSPDDGTVAFTDDERSFILSTSEFTTEFNAAFAARLITTIGTYTTKTVTRRTITCGGKVNNCVEGPIKSHAAITFPGGGLVSPIISTGNSYSQEYAYGTLNPNRSGNYVYANFRRELANSTIAYPFNTEDITDYTDYALMAYYSVFDLVKLFEPRVLDRYTTNNSYSNAPTTPIISSVDWEAESLENNKYGARPYAAEAFLGIGSFNGASNASNPFYTFECLNNARETTARIRILVRDWDRMVPTDTSSTELISDINNGQSDAAQDNTYFMTINPYEDEVFNDYKDWDDIIRFSMTPGPVFTPVNPFFDNLNFPQEDRSQ